ncbi:Pyridoxal biosynthesis protein PDX1 [Platanthera guangdongensis]|uniref:Pyridoxal biosynthesis protein PDX1 n=1 Tax=Platanthera guangdongensis TaxID=2320717 RepID=A0ABR2M4D8_9ASPA
MEPFLTPFSGAPQGKHHLRRPSNSRISAAPNPKSISPPLSIAAQQRAVQAATHYSDPEILADVSAGLGESMVEINLNDANRIVDSPLPQGVDDSNFFAEA